MLRYSGVKITSAILRLLGALLLIIGFFSGVNAIAEFSNHAGNLANPALNYGNPALVSAMISGLGAISSIVSGISFLAMGQLLQIMVHIANQTRPLADVAENTRITSEYLAMLSGPREEHAQVGTSR